LENINMTNKKFELGRLFSTPGVCQEIPSGDILQAIARHSQGDWGIVGTDDWEENELSLREGFRLFSVYESTAGTRFWIITEADRSATTVLLPDEY
jgi:hypothetical protein